MPETTSSARAKKTNGKSTSPIPVALARRAQAAALELTQATPAKAIRQGKRAGGARRGRSTTEDERTLAALLERRLRQLGLERAKVEAVATTPGQPADLRFTGIPVDRIDVLKKAIGR